LNVSHQFAAVVLEHLPQVVIAASGRRCMVFVAVAMMPATPSSDGEAEVASPPFPHCLLTVARGKV
jgi:hypothetical protein